MQRFFLRSPCSFLLTYYCKLNKEAPDRLRADLALVSPRVPLLRGLDLEDPFVPARVVVGLVSEVGRVREATNGQDVKITMTDPRNLKKDETYSMYADHEKKNPPRTYQILFLNTFHAHVPLGS
jgi:hypothetical protein